MMRTLYVCYHTEYKRRDIAYHTQQTHNGKNDTQGRLNRFGKSKFTK